MRTLAIDPGKRRLGLAISDPTGIIAMPLEVIERTGWARDLARLRQVIATYGITEVIVGRPLTLRGETGAQAQEAAQFADQLRGALKMAVYEIDERFSTAAADRAMREGGRRRSVRRAKRDAIAAALILQPYLDRRRSEPLPGQDGDVMLPP